MNPKISMDSSTSDANKHTNIPGSPSRTFGLAVGAVLVVLLPQQLGQDELVLLVQLLSLLPAGARRHRGSGAESPGQLRRRRTRAGAGRIKPPGAAGTVGGLSPGSRGGRGGSWNSRRSNGGGGRADVSRLLAGPAPHAPPEPAGGKGEGKRDGAVASGWRRRKEPKRPGALRMRRTSREASQLGVLPARPLAQGDSRKLSGIACCGLSAFQL